MEKGKSWGWRSVKWADDAVQEQPADIAKMQLPGSSKQTCVEWAAYTDVDVVDEIDSGL